MERLERFDCEAVLFDLDGVLVDSTRAVERVWREWADVRGLDADQILGVAHGRRTLETIGLVAPHLDAEAEAMEIERLETGNTDGILEVEGAHRLLSRLPTISWAVVTSGPRKLATGRLEYLDLPTPRVFVTADDVTRGKPEPEAYLKGAELLGVRPEACVVIEDAPAGIQAAKAAGMSVVALATTHEPAELSQADAVAHSLARIHLYVELEERPYAAEGNSRITLEL